MTDDGGFYWEGLEKEMEDPNIGITTWLGERFKIGDEGKVNKLIVVQYNKINVV